MLFVLLAFSLLNNGNEKPTFFNKVKDIAGNVQSLTGQIGSAYNKDVQTFKNRVSSSSLESSSDSNSDSSEDTEEEQDFLADKQRGTADLQRTNSFTFPRKASSVTSTESSSQRKAKQADKEIVAIFDAIERTTRTCQDCDESCLNDIEHLDNTIQVSASVNRINKEMATNFASVKKVISHGYYMGCSLKEGLSHIYKALDVAISENTVLFKVVSVTAYLAKGFAKIIGPFFKNRLAHQTMTKKGLFKSAMDVEKQEADDVQGDYVNEYDLEDAAKQHQNEPILKSYERMGYEAANAMRKGVRESDLVPAVKQGIKDYANPTVVKGLVKTFAPVERAQWKAYKQANGDDVSVSDDGDEDEQNVESAYSRFAGFKQQLDSERINPFERTKKWVEQQPDFQDPQEDEPNQPQISKGFSKSV